MRRFAFPKPALLLAVLAAAAFPLTLPSAARAGDGAGIGVARVSLVQGDVAIARGDSSSPVTAALNAPVLGADFLATGNGSRAEVQFDGTSMVRLGAGVQVRFTHLDRGDRALQLAQGTIELRLLRSDAGRFDVDTPSVSVRPRRDGSYRATVEADGTTQVTVRTGEADVIAGGDDRVLDAGNTLIAQGAAAEPALRSVDAIAYDDFDRFNADRDARAERALTASSSYVDGSIGGIDDLSAYGRWVNDGSYGNVWVPQNVAADWAPYRDGRWVWEDAYGWTWLANEPWGWAPYHYGRWYRSAAYGWCWYPPVRAFAVPVWQPALVAFFGFGNVGLGFGTIGWVPLAPFEPFYPWWRAGFGNTTVINNITNVTNVTNVYDGEIRRRFRNAPYATAQPGKRFLLGRFDHPVAVPATQLAQAQLLKGALPALPTAANLRYSDKTISPALAGDSVVQRRAFAGHLAITQRVQFEQQRESLIAGAQRSFAAPQAPAPHAVDPWSRFGPRNTAVEAAHPAAVRIEYGSAQRPAARDASTKPATRIAPTVRMPHEREMRRVQPGSVGPPAYAEGTLRSQTRVIRAPAVVRPAPPHTERIAPAPSPQRPG